MQRNWESLSCLTGASSLSLSERESRRRIRAWITKMVSRDAGIFQEEYLFGSFVRNPRTANDVDVLLIVRGRPGTKEWRLARTAVRAYITAFERISERPISITLLTEFEWREVQAWFAPEREELR